MGILTSLFQDEAVEEKAQEFLPGDTIANLASSNWKERLAGMETMVKVCYFVDKFSFLVELLITNELRIILSLLGF